MRNLNSKPVIITLAILWFAFLIISLSIPVLLKNIELPIKVIRSLDMTIFCIFPIGVIALFVVLINALFMPLFRFLIYRGKKTSIYPKKFPLKSTICFMFAIPAIFMLDGLVSSSLRNRTIEFLSEVSSNPSVRVNGELAEKPMEIIEELKKVRSLPAHHSRATKKISIEITSDGEILALELSRDSDRKREYWVFYPAFFRFTTRNHIGGIISDIFDGY